METYKVTFKNCPSVLVRTTSRTDAIRVAIHKTKGYMSLTDQRRNVISAKMYN